MNEYSRLLKEALRGEDEVLEPERSREALQASVRQFDVRMRTIRNFAWFAVAFLGSLSIYALVKLLLADDSTSTRVLIVWAVLFLWGMSGVGTVKFWLFLMQNNVSIQKELKRLQIRLAEIADRPAA